jgi:hypothetical protein
VQQAERVLLPAGVRYALERQGSVALGRIDTPVKLGLDSGHIGAHAIDGILFGCFGVELIGDIIRGRLGQLIFRRKAQRPHPMVMLKVALVANGWSRFSTRLRCRLRLAGKREKRAPLYRLVFTTSHPQLNSNIATKCDQ